MAEQKKQLGQLLIDSGKLDPIQLEEALEYKETHEMYLGKAILALGFLSERDLTDVLSEQLGIPTLDLMVYEVEQKILAYVKEDIARKNKVIPLFALGDSLTIAVADPMNLEIIDDLSLETGMEINVILATETDIEQSIDMYYSAAKYAAHTQKADGSVDDRARVISKEIAGDTEIVAAVNLLFGEAIKVGASDIHFEPRENDVRIRFRVDGVLQQYYTVPKDSMNPLVSRLKILADMDIAESRKPQDGRFTHILGKNKVDIRASTFPTNHGEKIVMRLLDETRGKIELHKLGFDQTTLKAWRDIVKIPNGIILVSGPTGSGKTTTLYATLNVVNTVEVNIMTIEDPIEYQLDDINQGQVNNRAGLTFAEALRSMLRQDPDMIMVGEMRDVETIELAIRAALTGHLVFSTIHTNDSVASYTRLMDMGIDSYLVSSTIRGILAQRLVRNLCPRCKVEYTPKESVITALNLTDIQNATFYKAVGCMHCKNSGYFGRTAVYELLVPNEEVIDLLNNRASASDIREAAERGGMISLQQAALKHVLSGRTSIDEMMRIVLG